MNKLGPIRTQCTTYGFLILYLLLLCISGVCSAKGQQTTCNYQDCCDCSHNSVKVSTCGGGKTTAHYCSDFNTTNGCKIYCNCFSDAGCAQVLLPATTDPSQQHATCVSTATCILTATKTSNSCQRTTVTSQITCSCSPTVYPYTAPTNIDVSRDDSCTPQTCNASGCTLGPTVYGSCAPTEKGYSTAQCSSNNCDTSAVKMPHCFSPSYVQCTQSCQPITCGTIEVCGTTYYKSKTLEPVCTAYTCS